MVNTNYCECLKICKSRSKYKNIEFIYSQCETSNFNNRICSFYKKIPSFNPNFIYLDGPDPMEVIPNKKISNKSINYHQCLRYIVNRKFLTSRNNNSC